MIKKFQEKLEANNLLGSHKKMLLAVSGGVDSVVLLDLMNKIPLSKRPELSIAHVNHHLRAVSNREEEFVKDLAEKYSLPFYSHQWLEENQVRTGIEKAAREERYNFFSFLMEKYNLTYLMTGHHLDDQIETILMRLTRGASLEQLLGIRFKQNFPIENEPSYLIRPLLDYSKEEIYEYAKNYELAYVEDASNSSLDYTRNRFRNQLIPLLKEENQQFYDHMKQFRMDLNDLIHISQVPINQAYEELVESIGLEIHLDLKKWKDYSRELQKAVITQILKKIYEGQDIQYKTNYISLLDHWMIHGDVNSSLDLTGNYLAEKSYDKVVFKKKEFEREEYQKIEFKITQSNQWVKLSETEAIVLLPSDEDPAKNEAMEEDILRIDKSKLHLPLTVRHRKKADRMIYRGLKGRKKIKDIFIDDKVPKREREKTWLIEDAKEEIIWLISHRKMNLFTDIETDKLFYNLKYIKNTKEPN